MTAYNNFTVDLPKRIEELDKQFRPIAQAADLDVSYSLMKLAAAFLLPYERIDGTSGARTVDIADSQRIRASLELDKKFDSSAYCSEIGEWALTEVDDFDRGPEGWIPREKSLNLETHYVLEIIRHAVAHSNLFFGGESRIEHVYFGSQRENNPETKKYKVIRCTLEQLDNLIDAWITHLNQLQVSPYLIWRELEATSE